MHLVWRYNLIYVFDSDTDSKGLFYPRALTQLITGLYMAEVCLIGLFALNGAFGPMVLIILLLIFTGIIHLSLGEAITPLVQSLPQTLTLEEEIREEEKALAAAAESSNETGDSNPGGAASAYYDTEQAFGDVVEDYDGHDEEEDFEELNDDHVVTGDRGVEGARSLWSIISDFVVLVAKSKVQAQAEESGLNRVLRKLGLLASNDPYDANNNPPPWLAKWLHPEVYEDFLALRKLIPADSLPNTDAPEQRRQCDYMPPEIWLRKPTLWIPRDEARVSRQEVAHTRSCIPISDVGARLDEKGRVLVEVEAAPFED